MSNAVLTSRYEVNNYGPELGYANSGTRVIGGWNDVGGHWMADFSGGYQKVQSVSVLCTNGECHRMNAIKAIIEPGF